MSFLNANGLPMTATARQVVEEYDRALDQLHRYKGDPITTIDLALSEDPEFVMGHVFRAGALLSGTEKGLEGDARRSVEAAEALAGTANERELRLIRAVRAWLDGDLHDAAARLADVTVDDPHDGFALQLGHLADFYVGDAGMLRDRLARAVPAWNESIPGFAYVLGMYAFGLEEAGDYRYAEDVGRRAVELARDDCWAIHAVAHVLEMEGRREEGIDWLTTRIDDWAPDNFFAVHNWWHLALYHLDVGNEEEVMRLYDKVVRPGPKASILDAVDASALLWRLHLVGLPVGQRWDELATLWASWAQEGYYAFNDAHAMMAYVAAGRREAAYNLLETLERRVDGVGSNATMTREVGLPICRALLAFGDARYGETVDELLRIRRYLHHFGGSHAQRDVFARTLVEAADRSGRDALSTALLSERMERRQVSPVHLPSLLSRARAKA